MAKQRRTRRTRKQGYSETEKLAYRLGQIERGKKNPNSKVYESYNRGLNKPAKKTRKTMFGD